MVKGVSLMCSARWEYLKNDIPDIVIIALSNLVVSTSHWFEFKKRLEVDNVDDLLDRLSTDQSLCSKIENLFKTKYRDILDYTVKIVGDLRREGIAFIPFNSPDYPEGLREYRLKGRLYRPLGLYVKPPISLKRKFIAVVGTRRCSDWGREIARETGRVIASKGFTLITGLAKCIDASAMLGALEVGGLTVGVRPWLKPLTLPSESKRIIERYKERVAVISEHYEKPPIRPKILYYLRNRIIAGMAELVVVVEARPEGGSMHQITWALKQGKPLAIYEHPDVGSDYYKAYKKYTKYSQTIILKDIDDLKVHLEAISKAN